MDFFETSQQILSLPISEKERNHDSRDRRPYHVFLSYFFVKFGSLNYDEKKDLLVNNGIWRHNVNEAAEEDSVMTPANPAPWDVMKLAARVWEGTAAELKEAWDTRTQSLNDRPKDDGRFDEIPDDLYEPTLEDNVMQSMTNEWRYIVSLFRHSVIMNIKKFMGDSERRCRFGKETVVLYTQAYKSFFMSDLIKLSIFGSPLFSNLLNHEVVHRTTRQTIVFIYSHRRMTDLFKFGGLSATTFYKDNLKYICCAKANLQRGTRNIIGYVMDEENNTLKVKVDGEDNLIDVARPTYDMENWRFVYSNRGANERDFWLSQLWPIRLKLIASGTTSFIISATSYIDNEPEHIQY